MKTIRLTALLLPFFCGCAVIPRGPVVTHEIDRFSGRVDGLVAREVWRDDAFGRGTYFFTDPKMTFTAWHTNQAALGGCSHVNMTAFAVTVDTNTAAIIGAGGTATGNIIGAAVKAAAK